MNFSLSNTLFYSLEYDLAALPSYITIVQCKTEVDDIVLTEDIPSIENYLDELDNQNLIIHMQKCIAVSDLNSLGLKIAARRVIDILIPKFSILLNINPDHIYRTVNSPPSYHYRTNIISDEDSLYKYCKVAEWINFFQRRWYCRNIAHPKYPEYQWDLDYARASDKQMILCLEHGLCYEYHHLDFILSFSDRLENLQSVKSFKQLYNVTYYPRPTWWYPYTGLKKLYDNLEGDRLRQMQRLYYGSFENSNVIERCKFIENNKPLSLSKVKDKT